MRKTWRAAVLVLAALASTLVGLTMAQPANAADIIAISNLVSGQCAEPAGVGNGALVVQRPCVAGNTAQLWTRIGVGDAFYKMVNVAQGGMCMDVRDGANPVQIWACGSSTTMNWSFQRVLGPFDNIKSRRPAGQCLDTLGDLLRVSSCTGLSGQIWRIS